MTGFEWALEMLRCGRRIRRPGWNGRGMYLLLVEYWNIVGDEQLSELPKAPFVAMKTADDKVVPWLCSQTDLLADDWETVD
jgi:hypothetical protein